MPAAPCPFCGINTADPNRICEDTVLFSTDHVVVLPALGPLERGHVMIVTREHFPSLAAATPSARSDALRCVDKLREILGPVIIWEHGMTGIAGAGGCIDHAHLNILPMTARLDLQHFDLPVLADARWDQLHQWSSDPYLLIGYPPSDRILLLDARSARSQLFRRVYAALAGRDDWDWALHPQRDLIEETINLVTA